MLEILVFLFEGVELTLERTPVTLGWKPSQDKFSSLRAVEFFLKDFVKLVIPRK